MGIVKEKGEELYCVFHMNYVKEPSVGCFVPPVIEEIDWMASKLGIGRQA